MGREIRRVPPTWEHPRQECKHSPWDGGCYDAKMNHGLCFKPLLDREYETDAKEWLQACLDWANGKMPADVADFPSRLQDYPFYWDYAGNPPDKDSYRPAFTDEPTHYQVYETVSEGTPVTPVFATKAEVVDYLATHGDLWDQFRQHAPWNRRAAEQFVEDGSCPSMVAHVGSQGVKITMPGEAE